MSVEKSTGPRLERDKCPVRGCEYTLGAMSEARWLRAMRKHYEREHGLLGQPEHDRLIGVRPRPGQSPAEWFHNEVLPAAREAAAFRELVYGPGPKDPPYWEGSLADVALSLVDAITARPWAHVQRLADGNFRAHHVTEEHDVDELRRLHEEEPQWHAIITLPIVDRLDRDNEVRATIRRAFRKRKPDRIAFRPDGGVAYDPDT